MPTTTYDSYTGIWIMPMHSLHATVQFEELVGGAAVSQTMNFVNAEADSTWNLTPITTTDFTNGGSRIVGFNCDITFIAAYNDFEAMIDDMNAIARGRVTAMMLKLKAQDAQAKGAQMEIGNNDIWQPLEDWSLVFETPQTEFRPRLTLIAHGTLSNAMFSVIDINAHRPVFFNGPFSL